MAMGWAPGWYYWPSWCSCGTAAGDSSARRPLVINGLAYRGIAVRFSFNGILRIVALDRLLAPRVVK